MCLQAFIAQFNYFYLPRRLSWKELFVFVVLACSWCDVTLSSNHSIGERRTRQVSCFDTVGRKGIQPTKDLHQLSLKVLFHVPTTQNLSRPVHSLLPSVLWRCWLGGRKGIRPVKNWVVGCWCGYLSGARCRLAYSPADATATHCLLLQ